MTPIKVQPVDRISIEAMDDIDELAVASGEGGRVGERQAWEQARLQQQLKNFAQELRCTLSTYDIVFFNITNTMTTE